MSEKDAPQRYSEKRLADSFTVYVLFSDELEFLPSEILEAVREDYPGLSWTDELGFNMPIKTGTVGLGAFFSDDSEESEPRIVHMNSMPGRCDVDWEPLFYKSRAIFPEAEDAVARHKTYLSITVGSVDSSLAARFDAARRATCLSSVFAKLPICTAVYFPSGDTVVKPENWVKAAETAMEAEVPIAEWITFGIEPVPDGKEPVPISVQTIGMAAFNGHEVLMPLVRAEPPEVVKWVFGATILLLEYGHEFKDSNTLGLEGETDPKIRIRHMSEGMMDVQTDVWALIHPNSTVDEIAVFGERTGTPPPPGYDNSVRGDPNSLKNKLYSFVAGFKK